MPSTFFRVLTVSETDGCSAEFDGWTWWMFSGPLHRVDLNAEFCRNEDPERSFVAHSLLLLL